MNNTWTKKVVYKETWNNAEIIVYRHFVEDSGKEGYYTYDVFADDSCHYDPICSSFAMEKSIAIRKAKDAHKRHYKFVEPGRVFEEK